MSLRAGWRWSGVWLGVWCATEPRADPVDEASPKARAIPGTSAGCSRGRGADDRDPLVERKLALDQPGECARDRRLDACFGERARQQGHRLERLDRLPDA